MQKIIITTCAFLLLMSCHERSEDIAMTSDYKEQYSYDVEDVIEEELLVNYNAAGSWNAKPEVQAPRTAQPTSPPPQSKDAKIIRSGRLSLDVEDIHTSKTNLDAIIGGLKGYYESEAFDNGYNTLEYRLKVRVPNEGFDKLVNGLDGVGTVTSKSINAKDVSEEYIDLEIRLENKLVALETYRRFLKKAKDVKEILSIQREIRSIEEEIESKKGRIRYLKDQVSYSTLNIHLIEKLPVIAKAESRHFGLQIGNAFTRGFDGLLNFIIVVLHIWPLWLLLIGLYLYIRRKKIKVS